MLCCVVFCRDCVFSGVHKLSVYKGTPTDNILRQLSQSAPDTVLNGAVAFSDGHVSVSVGVSHRTTGLVTS